MLQINLHPRQWNWTDAREEGREEVIYTKTVRRDTNLTILQFSPSLGNKTECEFLKTDGGGV